MNILDHFSLLISTQDILSKDKVKLRGACDGYNQMLIMSDFYHGDKSIFVVCPNIYTAQQYYDNLIKYVNEDDVLFFPADELISAEMVSSTGDFLFERIQTLYTLLSNEKKIVVMNMHAAIKFEMPKEKWIDNIFRLKINDEIKIEDLCNKLVLLGYEKTFTTSKTGEFSRRGSIVDIFPLGYEAPIRLDFFGDEIDTIKEFDVITQRSIEKKELVDILPVSEFLYSDKEFKFAKDKISAYYGDYELSQIENDNYKNDLFKLENHSDLDSLSRYMSFFEENLSTVFDFKENKRIYLIDSVKSHEMFLNLELDLNEYASRMGGMSLLGMKHYESLIKIEQIANVEIEGVRSFESADIDVFAKEVLPYNAVPNKIMDDFLKIKKDNLLIVLVNDEKRYKKLFRYLLDNEVFVNEIDDVLKAKVNFINLMHGDFPSFEMQLEHLIIINEETLFSTSYSPRRIRYKSIYKNAVKINKYDELNIGDYVVHYSYGIGKYMGIKTIKTKDIERDYLHVIYANKSALYIPLEQISNIMKYASADVEGVKLNSLGTTEWARTKAKARKRIHDISDKLLAIYSARAQAKGFACPEDTVEQMQFESEFDYELTPDQKKAVDAVKRDMESTRPMDRLICGDVGYGKTEVACRAAFKMVMSGGKQVLVLAPTTILARQHYYTFKSRMDAYGMRVELLSRFVPAKTQKKVIEDTLKGSVDILIGTHRVLSDEIKFKDLGLLIIDEEQRFGVTHKEKIKELKVNIDCITLTATPIPRTLQMSVMGIKDLSMIETPPKNRYPIQTYVLERNDRIIADAIARELARGGQVFYLYNYTDSIEEMQIKLKSLVPHARICVGHGKLRKDQLENVISKFIDKEYDVLLCTTIIETGIDIPETNTLIIHDADKLGLSQMYQIRGRVGRSSKIAYAYLMYEPRKVLTEAAEKRLETIKEFNELGSGFKIAMRDLSIRGAGDILGEEQSGFIETIGVDMYLKLLDEEINKKEEEPQEEKKLDQSIALPKVSRTIKESYVSNDDARIYIHKRIDKLKNIYEANELIDELADRFGKADNDLLLYIYEKLMNNYCKALDIYKIEEGRGFTSFIFTQEKSANLNGEKLFMLTNQYKNINLTQMNREVRIVLDIRGLDKLDQFIMICKYFNDYCS